jgi:metallophosphoesterase (TIGR03767 family)
VLKAAAAAAAVGATQVFPARTAAAAGPVAPAGTTLDTTVLRGPALNAQGYVRLVSGVGEAPVVRDELGTAARPGRDGRRRALLAFAHLTDIHVIDAQSPARVEFLDRYNDGPGAPLIFGSAYRPQEMLTPQLADSLVGAVERVGRGPVAGRRLDFAVCTGDNTDNCQLNELRWQMDVLDGTPFTPDSGDPARFEGVHDGDAASYDTHYWHPEGTPDGVPPTTGDDDPRRVHGFPVVRGLLDASRRPFTPRGLSIPWYTAYGNHDGLVQGNFPPSLQLTRVAEGPVKVVGLPAGVSFDDVARMDPAALGAITAAPVRTVTPDPRRRVITRTETVKEHFTTGGRPLGHGYTAENLAAGTAHYVFDPSPLVRGIVLDTVNPNGNSGGSLDEAQFAWLRAQLERSTGAGRDRLVVVYSHHTVGTMDNTLVATGGDPSPRVTGEQVRDLLLSFRNVVLWVNGHTHVNRVSAVPRPDGSGGFWEVSTAAHVDFPCQARLLELVDNRDGTLSIFGTVLDADAPLSYGGRLDSPRALASLARELAANDWQERETDRRGSAEDRNVELLLRAPFALSAAPSPAAPTPASAAPPGPAPRQLAATGAEGLVAVGALAATVGALAASRRARPTPD